MLLRFRPLSGLTLIAMAAGIAACSGGASVPPVGNGGAEPVATTVPLADTGGTQALPALGGYRTQVMLPANNAPSGTTIRIGESRGEPAGLAPLVVHRRSLLDGKLASAPSVGSPLLYFTYTPSQPLTLDGPPGYTIQIPAPLPAADTSVLLAYDDPQNGWIVIGQFAVNEETLTYTGPVIPGTLAITIGAGSTASFAVYASGSGPPTPQVAPSALVFMANLASGTLVASEPGYTGGFVAKSEDTTVAIVAPEPSSSPGTFVVTAQGEGNTNIDVTDGYGFTGRANITVTFLDIPETPEPSAPPSPPPSPPPTAAPSETPSPTPTLPGRVYLCVNVPVPGSGTGGCNIEGATTPLDVSLGTLDSTASNVSIPMTISEGFESFTGVQTPSYTGMISIDLGAPDPNIATPCGSLGGVASPATQSVATGTATVTIPNVGPPGCSFTITNSTGISVGVDFSVGNP
ncbi:MAG: hypothetical protein ACREM2_01875 [Vulcanimicrobiaceae bacterium]